MQEKNYYEILKINKSAESSEIHLAYKNLSKEYQINEFKLRDYVMIMQELNKAYLNLVDEDTRTEYDENIDNENLTNSKVSYEVDEVSAKENKVKLESCNFYVDSGGDLEAIGEVVSTSKKNIEHFMEMQFSVYDHKDKLIGTTKTFGNKAGKRMDFDDYIFIKPKSAIPVKVKIYFVK